MLVANSFSKNFGLYRRRTGALSVLTASREEAERVLSQLLTDIRSNNSNPPADGAEIVAAILGDPALRKAWHAELDQMRGRIDSMREAFVRALEEHGLAERFSHLRAQRGMFSYSGLTPAQVERLEREFSIYTVRSGRLCVAAMNRGNIPYIAESIAKVVADPAK